MPRLPLRVATPPVAALVALALFVAGCSGASTAATTTPSDAAGASSLASAPATSSVPTSAPTTSAPTSGSTSSTPSSSGAAQSPVSAENTPPGDIPDNVAFVPYADTASRFSFTHPEGWLAQVTGGGVQFTDKLNGVQVVPGSATTPPTVASTRAHTVPALTRAQAAFELRSVASASVPGGTGVLVVYRRNSAPDQVTGRQYRDEVQRYELVKNGHEVVVELFGPVGADNVDAYRRMITSLALA